MESRKDRDIIYLDKTEFVQKENGVGRDDFSYFLGAKMCIFSSVK